MQETHGTRVWSLDQEDPLEKDMATHSILGWRIPWTVETGGLQSTGSQRVRHDLAPSQLTDFLILFLTCWASSTCFRCTILNLSNSSRSWRHDYPHVTDKETEAMTLLNLLENSTSKWSSQGLPLSFYSQSEKDRQSPVLVRLFSSLGGHFSIFHHELVTLSERFY